MAQPDKGCDQKPRDSDYVFCISACGGSDEFCDSGANATAVPLGLLLSFGPMLSNFNQDIGKVSRFLYSQQINDLMNQPLMEGELERVVVIGINLLVVGGVFWYFAGKQRLAE